MRNNYNLIVICFFILLCSAFQSFARGLQETPSLEETQETPTPLVVYSSRHYRSDKQVYNSFTKKTGIPVLQLEAKAAELIQKIKFEGTTSEADILITSEIASLYFAKQEKILDTFTLPEDIALVSPLLFDNEQQWVAITIRPRVMVYDSETQIPTIKSFRELVNSDYRVLTRSSSNPYNIGLISALLSYYGIETTESMIRNLTKQFARRPTGNDRDQMKSLVSGTGDIAIVNSYYIGLLIDSSDPTEQAVGRRMRVITHEHGTEPSVFYNISAAGIVKTSKQKEVAQLFIKHLLSKESQQTYTELNYEYPVRTEVSPNQVMNAWGTVYLDDSVQDFNEYGRLATRALALAQKHNWQ